MLDLISAVSLFVFMIALVFLCTNIEKRIVKLEHHVNQLPCLSEPVEEKEGENNAPENENQ